MNYRDRQPLELLLAETRVLKPHQQANVLPWEPEPFDPPAVEPLPESRWLNGAYPWEEVEHE